MRQKAEAAPLDQAAGGRSLMALSRGETEGALRMLDEYSLVDCAYVRTVELPGKVVAAAAASGNYILAQENHVPQLLGIRRR